MRTESHCETCSGSGQMPTDFGPRDCPDCGGSGSLPTKSVLVEWRMRDIERALQAEKAPQVADARWLAAELRAARTALTEIIALAHDVADDDSIGLRIRFLANRALGLYDIGASAGDSLPGATMTSAR